MAAAQVQPFDLRKPAGEFFFQALQRPFQFIGRGLAMAMAMEARCYRGGEGRTRMHELVYKTGDFIALAIIVLLIAVLAVMRWGLGL